MRDTSCSSTSDGGIRHPQQKQIVVWSNHVDEERLHLSKNTVSRLVSHLIACGWAQRKPDVTDGRAVLVSLTDEGRDVADRLGRARARRFEDLLAAVPDDRRAVVIEGIGQLAVAARSARREVLS